MNALSKYNILLICYTFPPYPGIGGRRWAKFAKYLSQSGIKVHVVCANNPFSSISQYCNDVKSDNIKVYTLKSLYPIALLKKPVTFIQKLIYRFFQIILKIIINGSIYDKSIFWGKQFNTLADSLITKHNIKFIIASGAPFRLNYNAIQLKKKHSNLIVINDFRDPWTWGLTYGFKDLSKKRREFESRMEYQTVQYSDVIIVPDNAMLDHLKLKYNKFSKKIHVLPHGYDRDDFILKSETKNNKLLYYGTLYPDLDERFDALASSLSQSNEITLDIYSNSVQYFDYFIKYNSQNKVQFHQPINPILLFNEISTSLAVIIMQPDYAINFITTKIYEIIYSKTKILYIGNTGLLSQYIEKNNLGICINARDLNNRSLMSILNDLNSLKSDLDISSFDYQCITDNLINILQSKTN